jgi:hypothetical protein
MVVNLPYYSLVSAKTMTRKRCPLDGQLVENCPHGWCVNGHLVESPDGTGVGRTSSRRCKACRNEFEAQRRIRRREMKRTGRDPGDWDRRFDEWYGAIQGLKDGALAWLMERQDDVPEYHTAVVAYTQALVTYQRAQGGDPDEELDAFTSLTQAQDEVCELVNDAWRESYKHPSLQHLAAELETYHRRPLALQPPWEWKESWYGK